MNQTPSPMYPPTTPMRSLDSIEAEQRRRDQEHLKILAILHYVFGGLTALGGCAGLIYVILGILMASNPSAFEDSGSSTPPPPAWVGTMMAALGGCIMLGLWGLGGLIVYAGRCLVTHRHRVFCMIVAGIMCLSVPLGTLLGVFTLIVLSRPSVSAAFERQKQMPIIAGV